MNGIPRLRMMQAPREDRTERALFEAFLVGDDFLDALAEADSLDRVYQLKARINALLENFYHVQTEADKRASTLVGGC